ncbi:Sec-independent protein translocase subunit TatA [Nocardia vermiculata]|uniref:Sec-independent protein translocase protein TatA n=1 Tax=Nocardia vermiculata TaxID=257274 RepID=A0A846Y0Z8_9NOCA|nr:Sec-independent protein translocase subunit TatA [Nocardia vermiculata]NKY51732.1 Sec-independent protein translocase subunit TatA [Nocardia vermiculata]
MGSLSPTHWLIIALVILLLFGAKRLPDAARGVGRSLRIFKSEMSEMQSDGSGGAENSGNSGNSAAKASGASQQSAPAAELPSAQPVNPVPQADKDRHTA